MNLRETCKQLLHDVAQYKHEDKQQLMLVYINDRLQKSYDTYEKELQLTIEYLKHRNELNLARKMNRVL